MSFLFWGSIVARAEAPFLRELNCIRAMEPFKGLDCEGKSGYPSKGVSQRIVTIPGPPSYVVYKGLMPMKGAGGKPGFFVFSTTGAQFFSVKPDPNKVALDRLDPSEIFRFFEIKGNQGPIHLQYLNKMAFINKSTQLESLAKKNQERLDTSGIRAVAEGATELRKGIENDFNFMVPMSQEGQESKARVIHLNDGSDYLTDESKSWLQEFVKVRTQCAVSEFTSDWDKTPVAQRRDKRVLDAAIHRSANLPGALQECRPLFGHSFIQPLQDQTRRVAKEVAPFIVGPGAEAPAPTPAGIAK